MIVPRKSLCTEQRYVESVKALQLEAKIGVIELWRILPSPIHTYMGPSSPMQCCHPIPKQAGTTDQMLQDRSVHY